MQDDSLAAELAANLDESFERLVLSYQDRLYGFALRLTGSPQEAEEIAQDALVAAYRALRSYEARRIRDLALRPWLYRITLNTFRNRRRRRQLRVEALDGHDQADDERERPDTLAEQAELHAELAELVAGLPERYRVAVLLRHVQGLAYQEAADVVGQPVGTVKSNVHRGVELLRQALSTREIGAIA